MKKLVPLIVILLFGLSARADYHYASHEGSNEYPYASWETAADLIQNAVDATDAGDTVYIGAGEYYQTVQTWVNNSIGVIGMGMDSTFLYTDAYRTAALDLGPNCLIEGIKFRHDNNWRPLDTAQGANVIIQDCLFVDSHIGIAIHGGDTEVSNCIFDSCETAIFVPGGDPDILISNNLILDTYGYDAIYLQAYSVIVEKNIIINPLGSDILVVRGNPYQCTIRNNVAVNGGAGFGTSGNQKYNNIAMNINRTSWSYGIGSVYDDTASNNILIGCNVGISILSPCQDCAVNYNAFWDNNIDIDPHGNEFDSVGNIFVDPMLVSETDFHLQAFSPLIDAGDPNVFDVDGTRSDIGAYGGPYGCAYTYLDLAPQIPDSITVEVEEEIVILNWRFNTEADFNRYQIFRDTVSGFTPSEFNMIAEPDTSYYEDQDIDPGTAYYYRLTSVDNQGNVSDFSDEVGFIPTDISPSPVDRLPRYTVIESAYPNPFNSNVTIVYSASNLGPQPPEIKLQIFDIQGRVVRTLVDERMPMGTYRAIWDGTDNKGEPVSSGTYIAKVFQWVMDAGDFAVKITLIK